MKKRPSIISDPTLEEVLADEDVFIVEDKDSRADKDAENSDNEDEHAITNELKR